MLKTIFPQYKLYLQLIICVLFINLCFYSTSFAVELDLNKVFCGKYYVIASDNLRIYFPEDLCNSIDYLLSEFIYIKNKLLNIFPDQKDCEIPIILSNKDDLIENYLEINNDIIILPLFNDYSYFSIRSLTLYERFSLHLAYLYLLRSISSAYNAFKRKLVLFALPTWFLDGLAFYLAFDTTTVQKSILLDLARNKRLYTLSELDGYKNKRDKTKEEMIFQMHDMFAFWHKRANNKNAGIKMVKNLSANWNLFDNLFKKHFNRSIKNAFNEYFFYMNEECQKKPECYKIIKPEKELSYNKLDITPAEYLQNPIIIQYKDGSFNKEIIKIWVSSKRYSTEVYDLYYSKTTIANGKQITFNKVLLKNIHPKILYSEDKKLVFAAKYHTTKNLQKKLYLYQIALLDDNTGSKPKVTRIINVAGSFFPIKLYQNKLYFLIYKNSLPILASVTIDEKNQIHSDFPYKVEYKFNKYLPILDLAIDPEKNSIYFITQNKLEYLLCILENYSKTSATTNTKANFKILFKSKNKIFNLIFRKKALYFLHEKDFQAFQLNQLVFSESGITINTLTSLIGGVWSYNFIDDFSISAVTLNNGLMFVYKITVFPIIGYCYKIDLSDFEINDCSSMLTDINKYYKDFEERFLLPHVSKEYNSYAVGLYSYRSDTLNRYSMNILHSYGLGSRKYGYYVNFIKNTNYKENLSFELQDRILEQNYLSKDYFERNRSINCTLYKYINLSTKASFGVNISKRNIDECREVVELPTEGYDNSMFIRLEKKAIKTDPFSEEMPKDGTKFEFEARATPNFLKSNVKYNFINLKLELYEPIDFKNFLVFKFWIGEDNKKNNIRRPNDLYLGGNEYLRAYNNSYLTGNSLRYFCVEFNRPIKIKLPILEKYLLPELTFLKIFGEIGDAKDKSRSFHFLRDYGLEFRSIGLLFRRIPISLTYGISCNCTFQSINSKREYWSYRFYPLFTEF